MAISKEYLATLLAKYKNNNPLAVPAPVKTISPESELAKVTLQPTISERDKLLQAMAGLENFTTSMTPILQPLPEDSISKPKLFETVDRYGKTITLNALQSEAVSYASRGESFVLIGAAGTGKTTCQRASVEELILNGHASPMPEVSGHKFLQKGNPGIAIVAFTRRAVNNIRKSLPEHLKSCCMTVHKLLQFEPDKEEYEDAEGNSKTRMKFVPRYDASNPLPPSLKWVIFEESSMLGTDLYKMVEAAMPHKHNNIFLGDIQQLPPVFGPAILGFKLLELPVVELTEVYRQALESPILSLAWDIILGKDIPEKSFADRNVPGKLTIHPWKKLLSPEVAMVTLAAFFKKAIDSGVYVPGRDMILMTQNVNFGQLELNKHIATHLAKTGGHTVYEILAGFNKLYFREGDIVMVDKEDGVIRAIEPNPRYLGKPVQPASPNLNYWGINVSQEDEEEESLMDMSEDDIDRFLLQVQAGDEDRVNQASHSVRVYFPERDCEEVISDAGTLNLTLLGYAMTVHKSQGSEWDKVFFVSHSSNGRMLQRELVYTAVTRAKEELYVICAPEMLQKAVKSQAIKGDTLAEKAEVFKGKAKKLKEEEMN